MMIRPFGLDGKPTRPKVFQETGSGLAVKVSVLTNHSFCAPLSFTCPSLTALGYFIFQVTNVLMKICNFQQDQVIT